MDTRFRDLPKARINHTLPHGLFRAIKRRAAEELRPENAVMAEALCVGLGLDPADYGLATAVEGGRPCH